MRQSFTESVGAMDQVAEYLEQLNMIDRQEAAFRAALEDLSMREFRLLAAIANEPLILKKVGAQRAVSGQGTGRMVERLRQRGLLNVERYSRDKRAKLATITEAGEIMLGRGAMVLANLLDTESGLNNNGLDRADRIAQRA